MVRVSGMSTVRVNVWVRVRVSNLLSPDSGEYMANGLTNAIRQQLAMIAK